MQDLHGTDRNGAPEKDEDQNYLLLEAQQNNTHTVLKISRALDTCDHLHDVILGSDTVRVIWSLYLEDPPLDGSTWQYHGKEGRGSRSLHLLSPPGIPKPSHDHGVLHWDVTLSQFEIPENMNTLYWCKIFKVPPLRGKHHMIGKRGHMMSSEPITRFPPYRRELFGTGEPITSHISAHALCIQKQADSLVCRCEEI
uniref:DOMON domain-containing protein n=1 Tax=Timema poppense TaxID=170557 RepID=A0A7R9DX78_TIMPO|nr:unnamed protein product [Timema poppensis]